jgi:hypothetical protein
MTTLTVFLINVHAHLIFFLSILISNKSAQNLSRTGYKNFKKINLLYIHWRTYFTKVILAKTL